MESRHFESRPFPLGPPLPPPHFEKSGYAFASAYCFANCQAKLPIAILVALFSPLSFDAISECLGETESNHLKGNKNKQTGRIM